MIRLLLALLYRTPTVDSAVKDFNKAIAKLDKAAEVHDVKAGKALAQIDALTAKAEAFAEEADRAARLAKNLGNLLK